LGVLGFIRFGKSPPTPTPPPPKNPQQPCGLISKQGAAAVRAHRRKDFATPLRKPPKRNPDRRTNQGWPGLEVGIGIGNDPSVFRHCHTCRVTYADCTVGNHIYYGRYLELLESARGELFRAAGRTFAEWQAAGVIFPVIEVQLRYRAPARYDELLTLETTVCEATGIRLSFGYRIVGPDGSLRVEGKTRHVCTSLEDRPRRLPPELTQLLQHPGSGEIW
jgi:acyl-CoA thioester hydrolase